MAENELDVLSPVPEEGKLSSGTLFYYEELRSRQLFRLLRIITRGAAPLLAGGNSPLLDLRAEGVDAAEWAERMLALLVFAVPEAEDEALEFIRSMVRPHALVEHPTTKSDQQRNATLSAQLSAELSNPPLEDVLTVIEGVLRRESPHLMALGKRMRVLVKVAQQTGQVPTSAPSPGPTSSAASPEPSTFSPPSTAGPTTSSPTSASAGSGSASPLSSSDDVNLPGLLGS